MNTFTAYSATTGQVLYGGTASNPNQLADPLTKILVGTSYKDGWIGSNEVHHPQPPCPGPTYVWDWVHKRWDPDENLAWEQVRTERNSRLRSVVDSMNPIWWATLDTLQQAQWTGYRQALLDITQQEDPWNIVWPVKP